MNKLSRILNLMERIDKDYHQYTMLINEDKRGKAAKNACYNVFRQYFNDADFLDREFVHQDNPEHLSAIDYMYKQFMDAFYHDPATRAGAVMRLAPMFLRLALESGFQQGNDDANKLNRLRNILNYIHQANKTNGLDLSQIDINTTFDELNNAFGKEIDNQNASMKDRINNGVYDENNNFNGYKIVGPLTFEEANKYGNKSCPNSKLCYTQGSSTWNAYTANGVNNAYVLLRDGWENVPPEHDNENDSAYDTYGLSMIFVFVDEQGDLAYCNTRWNHSANYKPGCSVDNALNEEDITQLIGRNFYKVFKPNNKWNEIVEDAMTRIKNGEALVAVFESVSTWGGSTNSFIITLNKKSNVISFINDEPSLLFDKWLRMIFHLSDGFARVKDNGKWNLVNENGEFLSTQWFNGCTTFHGWYSRVKLNNKLNYLTGTGDLLSSEWFDEAHNFSGEIAPIEVNGKGGNYIKRNGELLSSQWFDFVYPFTENGLSTVLLNSEYNLMRNDGTLVSDWFDSINRFNDTTYVVRRGDKKNLVDLETGKLISPDLWFDGISSKNLGPDLVKVINDGKMNILNKNGNLLSNEWFDYIDYFFKGYALVRITGDYGVKKENLISQDGKLLSNIWFDSCGDFERCNICPVSLQSKSNFINTKGEILSDMWFDYVSSNDFIFYNIARVELNQKYNMLNKNGELIFSTWFDTISSFDNFSFGDFAFVKLDSKYNLIDSNGVMRSSIWFDDLDCISNGYMRVILNNKQNLLDIGTKQLISPEWYDAIEIPPNRADFCEVEKANKVNLLNVNNGRLISPKQWFDSISRGYGYNDEIAEVELNGNYYLLYDDGSLGSEV